MEFRRRLAGLRPIEKRNLRPSGQVVKDRIGRDMGVTPESVANFAAHAKLRHHPPDRQGPVEIGPAQPNAVAFQNVDLIIPALPEQREIRGAAADIDDQPQIPGTQGRAIAIAAASGSFIKST